jgi:hypothetical protein
VSKCDSEYTILRTRRDRGYLNWNNLVAIIPICAILVPQDEKLLHYHLKNYNIRLGGATRHTISVVQKNPSLYLSGQQFRLGW